jgi:2-keto-4-pentenoate hydratase/2-oxohepta-3-ene-1,7-dioic acid hydratase in catechol pathway
MRSPPRKPVVEESQEVVVVMSTSGGRHFGVNVGEFPSRYEAEKALLKTALAESATLNDGLRKTTQSGGAWRASFMGLTEEQAELACRRLTARAIPCETVGRLIMVALVFPALPTVTLPVTGRAERFPVRRIFCVGRNYAEHTKEMGGDPEKEAPFFFTKPADAVVESGSRIPYPPATTNLHHEGELVVAIGKGGRDGPKRPRRR